MSTALMNIDAAVYAALLDAAEEAMPQEACGLLAGRDGRATHFYPLTNADASNEHYRMLPEEQFAAVKQMRADGLTMLSIWHSHPETPARMSEEDLRLAYTPGMVYTILSLAEPQRPSLRGYTVTDGVPSEVPLEVEIMTNGYYSLPADLVDDIEQFADEVVRFKSGELAPGIFKARRVPRGIYEQREDGTYMLRIRISGGALSAVQARTIAALAAQYGQGPLHVTTRQDVQLHDLAIDDIPAILRALLPVGLSGKGGGGNTVRNVAACPFAGVCPSERFDVTPFAWKVTEHLMPLVGSYNLPRKYKIAFSGCAADCALATINDLGFIADMQDGAPGFRPYVAGGMGAHSRAAEVLDTWIPADDVVRVAEAVRRLFDEHGDRSNKHRARLRFVMERLGLDAFRTALQTHLDAARLEFPVAGVAVEPVADPAPPTAPDVFTTDARGLHVVRQRQPGRVSVVLHLPMGFLGAADLDRLSELAELFSDEQALRTTRQQNLVMRSVAEDRLDDLARELDALEVDVCRPKALDHFVACAGASTCRLGLCLSRGAAGACADALADDADALDGLVFNVSGCPNACGQHPAAQVGFYGAATRAGEHLLPAYKVVVGASREGLTARLGELVGTVPARRLPDFCRDLVAAWKAGGEPGQRLSDYLARQDGSFYASLTARHAADAPAYEDDPDFYRDWGQPVDFSLAGRGAGECSSGVFEVIRADLQLARKSIAAFEEDRSGEIRFNAFLAVVRALLVVRGMDSREPIAIIHAFETHFVETGLVAARYNRLLARGEGYLNGRADALFGREEEIEALCDRVERLYGALDASLEFHPPEAAGTDVPAPAAAASGAGPGAVPVLDLKGVACPMNFVKTKLRLETLATGDKLTVILDDGEPVQNVPTSLKQEGHEILSSTASADGSWEVLVQKG